MSACLATRRRESPTAKQRTGKHTGVAYVRVLPHAEELAAERALCAWWLGLGCAFMSFAGSFRDLILVSEMPSKDENESGNQQDDAAQLP